MGRALIIGTTQIEADGRALRFGRALQDIGYHVTGVGFGPNDRNPPPVDNPPFQVISSPAPRASHIRRWLTAFALAPTRIVPRLGHSIYWLFPENLKLRAAMRATLRSLPHPPDLVIAKHWTALPVAFDAVRITGARLLYDINEVSHAEHDEDWRWRLLVRRYAVAIEREGLRNADLLTTFGLAAAEEIRKFNNLSECPIVVRNVPNRFDAKQRPDSEQLTFLYHGSATEDRGLEELIDSVRFWLPDRQLVLRLTGKPSYIAELKSRISEVGSPDRIEIVPPVEPDKVVAAASNADVGLCLFPAHSRQKLLVEPNKLYQYIAAGNAVLATDLPAMRQILQSLGCGRICAAHEPSAIAEAVNSLSISEVRQMQNSARAAAQSLCWEHEQQRLQQAVRSVLDCPKPDQSQP